MTNLSKNENSATYVMYVSMLLVALSS